MTSVPGHDAFRSILRRRTLVAAGAIGTSVLAARPSHLAEHGNIVTLLRDEPGILAGIQDAFYAAGCDLVDTATFDANAQSLARIGREAETRELNRLAAAHLNAVRDAWTTPAHPRFSAGSIGPGWLSPVRGEVSYPALVESYAEQVHGLLEGGVDVLKVESVHDVARAGAALEAIRMAMRDDGANLPVIVSFSPLPGSALAEGVSLVDAARGVAETGLVDAVGVNCGAGPAALAPALHELAGLNIPLFFAPAAGIPGTGDRAVSKLATPGHFAAAVMRVVRTTPVSIAGGCCGATPAHLAGLSGRLQAAAP